ncbi:hypothetical protein A9995_08640 [Erythrobacter sp. QSSC1-22B]|uniref:DUF4062 domain-containing protein n=1 Tax=Erythrobacter sp. QSSC1-22B TaxID=1860125 RepID=UPI000805DE8A|nr:DUF4062 domain-containing protein [Erythrobacter sp. QSSC1-22B]OBX19188.1 hypothetical protein A9995_08640 [Erythrobacter sp. QSSC1-22B]
MSDDKRYQVFVSSTYLDLVEERKEVMQALLELDCIPAGMELFQAADEDQWSLIKRVIDDCDYYMVIIGGRYGSLGPDGISYTEMEYRYALEIGKPIVAFLHQKPDELAAKKTEVNADGAERLEAFRELCQQRVVKYWDGPQSLGSVVSRSIVRLIKDRPAIGWIRGSAVASDDANREIVQLRKKIDELEGLLQTRATSKPENTDNLLQIGDMLPVSAIAGMENLRQSYRTDYTTFNFSLPFELLFKKVGPKLLEEVPEATLKAAVDHACRETLVPEILEIPEYQGRTIETVKSSEDSFQKMKVQLIALGLIVKGDKKRTVSDKNVYWKLTPFGETQTMKMIAMRKGVEN